MPERPGWPGVLAKEAADGEEAVDRKAESDEKGS